MQDNNSASGVNQAGTASEDGQLSIPLASSAGHGSAAGPAEWHTNLAMLSGGQRTLVSMAMLLAVARAGNGSRLILLDEADAALDEHNQARVAALLKQLARGDDQAGCQILCVTHNLAFQQACDAFVRVAEAAAGNEGAGAPAGGVAAADPVRGAKKAKEVSAGGVGGATAGSRPKRVRFAASK